MGGNVLFCGAWDEGPGYPRTRALRAGLLKAGFTVHECRVPGIGAEKQTLLRQPWRWPALLWRNWRQRHVLRRQLRAALGSVRPRCVVVPYPGHFIVRDIARHCHVPVVLDLFLSAYDTVVEDRRVVEPGSVTAHWLQRVDAQACAAADLVLLDTPANAAYAVALTGVPAARFAWLPISDPDAPEEPSSWSEPACGRLRVLFFGTGVPLHGLRTLIDAVALASAVELTLVGGTAVDRAHAKEALGTRLVLEPSFVDRVRLQVLIEQSHVVAGVFGSGGKTQRVVPWKLVHALAAGRPVLTAETPAVCGWLEGSGAIFTTPSSDTAALAAMLQRLASAPDLVRTAATRARAAYDRHFAIERTAERWNDLLERLPAAGDKGPR